MAAASGSNAPIINDALVAWPPPPSRARFASSSASPPQSARNQRFSLASPPASNFPTFANGVPIASSSAYSSPKLAESGESSTYTSPKGKGRALPLTIDVDYDEAPRTARRLDYGTPRRPLTPAQLRRIAQSFGIMAPPNHDPSTSTSPLRSTSGGRPTGSIPLLSVPSQNLVAVVPPAILLPSDPALDPAEQRERLRRFRRGRLLPLQPTLGAMLMVIAREFGLPSTLGVNVYLGPNGGAVREELLGTGSQSSASGSDEDDPGPLITTHTWLSLFAHASRSSSPATTPSTTPRKPKAPRSAFGVSSPLSASPLASVGDSLARAATPGTHNRRGPISASMDEPSPFRTSQGSSSASSFSPHTPGSFAPSTFLQMPVFGTIEFEVDPEEALWLPSWLKAGGPIRRRAASDTMADQPALKERHLGFNNIANGTANGAANGIRNLTLVERLKDDRPKFLRDMEERERALERAREAEREAKALAAIAARRAAEMEALRRQAEEERMAEEARIRSQMEAEAEAEEERRRLEMEAQARAEEERRRVEAEAEERRRVEEEERLRVQAEAEVEAQRQREEERRQADLAAEEERRRAEMEAEAENERRQLAAMTEAETSDPSEVSEQGYAALDDGSDGSDYSDAEDATSPALRALPVAAEPSSPGLPMEDPIDDLAELHSVRKVRDGPLTELDIGTDRVLNGPIGEDDARPTASQEDLHEVAALLNAVDANPEVLSDPSLVASPRSAAAETLLSSPEPDKPGSQSLLGSPFVASEDSRLASPIALPTRSTSRSVSAPTAQPAASDSLSPLPALPTSPNGGTPISPMAASPALAHLRNQDNDVRASGQVMEEQLNSLERMMRDLSPREIHFNQPSPPTLSTPRLGSNNSMLESPMGYLPPRGSSRLPYLQPDEATGRMILLPPGVLPTARSVSEPTHRPTFSQSSVGSPPPIPYRERDPRAGHAPRSSAARSSGANSSGGGLPPPRPQRPPTPDLTTPELPSHTLPQNLAVSVKEAMKHAGVSPGSNAPPARAPRPSSISLRGLKRQVSKTVLRPKEPLLRPKERAHAYAVANSRSDLSPGSISSPDTVGLFPRQGDAPLPPSSFGSMRSPESHARAASTSSMDGDDGNTLRSRLFSFGQRRRRDSTDDKRMTINHISSPIAATHKHITPAELVSLNPAAAAAAALPPRGPVASASMTSLASDNSPTSPHNVRRKPVPSIEGGSTHGSTHGSDFDLPPALHPPPPVPTTPSPNLRLSPATPSPGLPAV